MSDYAHRKTDEEIRAIEKRLRKEYKKAEREVQAKLDKHFERYKAKDEAKREQLDRGEISKEEYRKWRTGQIAVGKRWQDMRDTIAQDYARVNQLAREIVNESKPKVYAENANYEAFRIDRASGKRNHFTIYNKDAIKVLAKDNPQLLPNPGKATTNRIYNGLDVRWNRQQIQSVLMQGILQGESIPKLSKRLANEVGDRNMHAAIRNARTAMTCVQNKARLDSMKRAEKMGIKLKKCWIATHDGRTRHWHLDLDGEMAKLDEPFVNDYGEIMYPGDPGAEPANVYNCRCRLIEQLAGHEIDTKAYRESGDTYEYKDWLGQSEKWEFENRGESKGVILGDETKQFTIEDIENMQEMLDAAPQEIQDLWMKAQDEFAPCRIDPKTDKSGLVTNPDGTKEIVFRPKSLKDNDVMQDYECYFHEYFHNIDGILGADLPRVQLSWDYRDDAGRSLSTIITDELHDKFGTKDNTALKSQLGKYYDRLRNDYDPRDYASIVDMTERMAVKCGYGEYPMSIGHGLDYAVKYGSLEQEAFAEIGAAIIANPGAHSLIQQELPKTYAAFWEIVRKAL
jgi:SPP1 gp7 family putative phage head morphogenesis protein